MLACDLVVAADHVRFALPGAACGRTAGAGGLVRLAHQLPVRLASELALTGAVPTATDAARWGLVNPVVPAEELMSTALALVEAISLVMSLPAPCGSPWPPPTAVSRS